MALTKTICVLFFGLLNSNVSTQAMFKHFSGALARNAQKRSPEITSPWIPYEHFRYLSQQNLSRSEFNTCTRRIIKERWSFYELQKYFDPNIKSLGTAFSNFKKLKLSQKYPTAVTTLFKNNYIFYTHILNLPTNPTELDIENSFVKNIEYFLQILGNDFTFVQNQRQTEHNGKIFRFDILLFHTKLNCYVVIELKNTDAKFEHAEQLKNYINIVDEQLRCKYHNPTIGLLLAPYLDRKLAHEILGTITDVPIALATFNLIEPTPQQPTDLIQPTMN